MRSRRMMIGLSLVLGCLLAPQVALAEGEGLLLQSAANLQASNTEAASSIVVEGADLQAPATQDDQVTIEGTFDFDAAKEQLELTNAERAKAGAPALVMNADLQAAAMQRAGECALDFSHTRPDGSSCYTASASVSMWGENIAAGSNTAEATTKQWMDSPGHKANMLDSDYSSIGIGVFRVGAITYWVQDFGAKNPEGYAGTGTKNASVSIDVSYSTVPYEGSGFNLNMAQSDPEPLNAGETYQLQVGIKNPGWDYVYGPTGAASYTWESSDPTVCSVDANGIVTAQEKSGTATITATSKGGYVWKKTFKVSFVDLRATVIFDANGGSAIDPVKVKRGDSVAAPADPTKPYYRFGGWFDDPACLIRHDFTKPVLLDMTLYARWDAYSPYKGFRDVRSDAWYVTGGWIDYSVAHGLMSGYRNPDGSSSGLFGPDDHITREQVATVLYRASGANVESGSTGFVDDAQVSQFARAAVRWARDMGIITGYVGGPNDGKFGPQDLVTRQDFATMAARFARLMGRSTSADESLLNAYADASQIDSYARGPLAWCRAKGVMTGYAGSDLVMPQANTSRCEATKVLTVLVRDVL